MSIAEVNEKFHINLLEKYQKELEKLQKQNLIAIDSHIYLTEKGLDLANLVWEEFI